MKPLSASRVGTVVGIVSFPFLALADSPITSENWRVADPLVYSDLVMECVVARVGVRELSFDEAGIEPIPKFTPVVGTIEVVSTKLLRGGQIESSLAYELGAGWHPRVDERIVLCAIWVPRLKAYQVVNDDSVLQWDGTEWRRISGHEHLDDPTLSTRVHNALPENVVGEADIVAIGRLNVLPDSLDHRLDGRETKSVRLSMDVEDLLRGNPQTVRHITFLAAADINVERLTTQGDRWMVALERNGSDLWLGDVLNGLLKVEADHVKLAGWRPYHLSVSDMKRIASESRNESNE